VSTRQGFYWWEYDFTYYILKVLSWFGIVWKLQPVPAKVLEEGRARGKESAPLPQLALRSEMQVSE
jgi:stearoyl-CoA desaturase (delta-9 desaturase)